MMQRLLALGFFVACCTTAFFASLLVYTYVTGDTPFISRPVVEYQFLESIAEMRTAVEGKGKKQREISVLSIPEQRRMAEKYAGEFLKKLQREKENITREREKLAREKQLNRILIDQSNKLQNKIVEQQNEVRKLINEVKAESDKIQSAEVVNLKKLANIIAGMEVASSQKIVLAFDERLAAKILNYMSEKNAAKIISQALTSNDKKVLEKIKRITDIMARITEEKKK